MNSKIKPSEANTWEHMHFSQCAHTHTQLSVCLCVLPGTVSSSQSIFILNATVQQQQACCLIKPHSPRSQKHEKPPHQHLIGLQVCHLQTICECVCVCECVRICARALASVCSAVMQMHIFYCD